MIIKASHFLGLSSSDIQVRFNHSYTFNFFSLQTSSEQLNLMSSTIFRVIWCNLKTFRHPRWCTFYVAGYLFPFVNISICNAVVCTLVGLAWGKNICLVSFLALTLLEFALISEVGAAFWMRSLSSSSHYIVSICQKLILL